MYQNEQTNIIYLRKLSDLTVKQGFIYLQVTKIRLCSISANVLPQIGRSKNL